MSTAAAQPTGEVGVEIAPVLDRNSVEGRLAAQVDRLLRRTCEIARSLIGAEQAALKLCVRDDPAQARKYFSMSERYAAYDTFRVDPRGIGLHGMTIPPGDVVRLTQAEVLAHPQFRNFDTMTREHPPMRGWLATGVWGADGQCYGLLQLSDKTGGGDFDDGDEDTIRDLAMLVGDALDWLTAGA